MIEFSRSRFFDPESEKVIYCGLDLGQAKDYTAMSVIERRKGIPAIYHVRHLKRFELGTSYPSIASQVREVLDSIGVKPSVLIIDGTGAGRPVCDLFQEGGLFFYTITITGGYKVNVEGRSINVPKRDLISNIQILLQTKRLKIPSLLPEAQTLVEEMSNFQVKISQAGHDSYGAWREGTHDDLLLAVALACWAAENKLLPKGLHWPRVSTGRNQ